MPKIPLLVFHLISVPFSDDVDQNPPTDRMPSPGLQNHWIVIHTGRRYPELPILTVF
jgi:hypothetical protein